MLSIDVLARLLIQVGTNSESELLKKRIRRHIQRLLEYSSFEMQVVEDEEEEEDQSGVFGWLKRKYGVSIYLNWVTHSMSTLSAIYTFAGIFPPGRPGHYI